MSAPDELIARLRKRAKEDQTCADNSAVVAEALAGQMKLFEDRDEQRHWNTYAVRMAVDHRNSVKRDAQYAADLIEAAQAFASSQEEIALLRKALEPFAKFSDHKTSYVELPVTWCVLVARALASQPVPEHGGE